MTPLALKMDMPDEMRGLLECLDGYPNSEENMGFQPSLLRYKVRMREDVSSKTGYEGFSSSDDSMVSKTVEVDSVKTWYEDDDWLGEPPSVKKRLGTSIDLEPVERKREIQDSMLKWCRMAKIGNHVDSAIRQLWPSTLSSPPWQTGYGVKFDLYTNRVAPAWHQDWDHGHALFVALVNLTRRENNGLPIKGAEILDFTKDAGTESSALVSANSDASRQRTQLMSCKTYQVDDLAG